MSYLTNKKIKYMLITLMLMAFLSGCNTSDNTTASDSSKPKLMEDIELALSLSGDTYKTHTVTTADITSTHHFKASTDFFYVEDIVFPYKYGKIILLDTYAETNYHSSRRGIRVGAFKKGDPIARYKLFVDPLRIEELEAELSKAELQFSTEITPKKSSLDKLKSLIDTSTSVEDILYYKSLYDEALNEYNELVAAHEAYIAPIKEELEFYATTESEFDIYSPGDGIVTLYEEGDGNYAVVNYGDVIGTFSVIEGITLNIHDNYLYDDVAVDINFGTRVEVTGTMLKFGGTVIGAPNALYSGSMYHAAVAFDDYYNTLNIIGLNKVGRMSENDSHIDAKHTIADNAIVLPAKAIEPIISPITDEPTSMGKVIMYNDGVPYKTIVTYIYSDPRVYWITSGLEVGDVIVIP